MKHKSFLPFLVVAPLILAGCDGSFGSGGKAKRKDPNIVNVKDWNAVFEPENFSMHTNFSHKVVQTVKGKDGKEIERCSEEMEMDSGKIHVIQKYANVVPDEEGNLVLINDEVYTIEGYYNFLKIDEDECAEYELYMKREGAWQKQSGKDYIETIYLDLALFEFPFEEFEFNSKTNSYYSEQYTYEIEHEYHLGHLKEIRISKCDVKFNKNLPVSYDFDFTSINTDGTDNLTAHMTGTFGDYNKIKLELPEVTEVSEQS